MQYKFDTNLYFIAEIGSNFNQDLKTKVSKYGKNQAAALKIMTEAGWE